MAGTLLGSKGFEDQSVMRLYITHIESEDGRQLYAFGDEIRGAWSWEDQQEAENACAVFRSLGITVLPERHTLLNCTDFRAEAAPDGRYAVSCEFPDAGVALKQQ